MKRRSFIHLLGAAIAAPALPALGAPAPAATAAAGYNRYMYGLAVFQARTRAGLTAADLMGRLGVNAAQARALMGEMTARGVLSPVTGAVTGVTAPQPRKAYVRKMQRLVEHALTTPEAGPEDTDAIPTQYRQNTDVVSATPSETQTTTSCGPKLGVH